MAKELKRLSTKVEYQVEFYGTQGKKASLSCRGIAGFQDAASFARKVCDFIPIEMRVVNPITEEERAYSIRVEACNVHDFNGLFYKEERESKHV